MTGVLTIERVRRRNALALVVVAVRTGVTIAAYVVLIPRLGVSGGGLGLLPGQCLAAAAGVYLLARRSRRKSGHAS